jgi:hypothetical protein
MTDLLVRRFANERLVNSPFTTPRDVVAWFGAVQAQDFYASTWAVGMRIPGATEKDIERALHDGSIIKTWAMRGTLHYVTPDDFRWIMKLTAPRMMKRFAYYHKKIGLTEAIVAKSEKVIVKALKGRQLTRAEIKHALVKAGLRTAEMKAMFMLSNAVYKGHVCWGPRRGKQFTFVLVDEWVPKGKQLTHDEARIELARRYFTSHGPATVRDYVWWSSLTVKDAKFALAHLKHELTEEVISGKAYYAPKKQLPVKRGMTDLIPIYDEYTIAFQDRDSFYDVKYKREMIMGFGYIIVRDGKAVGTWQRKLDKKKVTIKLKVFDGAVDQGVVVAAKRYADFVGKKLVVKK